MDEDGDEDRAGGREARGREEARPPRGAENGVHEVRAALAERECADESAEREAAPGTEPRREDLHARGIDAREPEARQKAQDEGRGRSVGEERERRVRGRGEEGRALSLI